MCSWAAFAHFSPHFLVSCLVIVGKLRKSGVNCHRTVNKSCPVARSLASQKMRIRSREVQGCFSRPAGASPDRQEASQLNQIIEMSTTKSTLPLSYHLDSAFATEKHAGVFRVCRQDWNAHVQHDGIRALYSRAHDLWPSQRKSSDGDTQEVRRARLRRACTASHPTPSRRLSCPDDGCLLKHKVSKRRTHILKTKGNI